MSQEYPEVGLKRGRFAVSLFWSYAEMKEKDRRMFLLSTAIISLCFLLTSTGYLAWTYNVMGLTVPGMAEAVSLVAGYLLQAAGIGFFVILLRRKKACADQAAAVGLILYILCLVPAALSSSFMTVSVTGFLLNLWSGWIAGYYLYQLTDMTPARARGMALGAGYGVSIVLSWLFTLPEGGSVYDSKWILAICLFLTAAVFVVIRIKCADGKDRDETVTDELRELLFLKALPLRSLLIPAAALVLVFSILNSSGFGFPSVHLQEGIRVETSRLFYAAGLVIAGFVHDRDRRYGALCALAALVMPFMLLALRGEPVPLRIFWALSYFSFGFYSVYRMLLFSDIAKAENMLWLSGCGLLAGRIGDALGEAMNLLLLKSAPALIGLCAALFVTAVILFFRIYRSAWLPDTEQDRSEQERFDRFSAQYDLSSREREVLRMLLLKKTNMEIAEELSVSERTVRFHIHNLLQKTGCRNRVVLLSAYTLQQDVT